VVSTVTTVLFALLFSTAAASAKTGPLTAPVSETTSPTVGGGNDSFNGDSCTSPTFCMAVGHYSLKQAIRGLSEMLRGAKWVAKAVPSPSKASNAVASEVSCASPTSCLLVGAHFAGPQSPNTNLAEAWNGSSWRIVADTGPAGTAMSDLADVACPTTKFCLAVGVAGPSSTSFQDAAYTWTNGNTWRQITVLPPRGARSSELTGLACSTASNCMALGDYVNASGRALNFAARWHDGRWEILSTPAVRGQPFTIFQGISCPTATECVAVGNTMDNASKVHAFAEVWSGGKWRVSTLRQPQSIFFSASCPAPNSCFASGDIIRSSTTFAHPLIEHWNGRSWTTQRAVQTAAPHNGDILTHISCVSGSRCETAGFRFNPHSVNSDLTLAEVWNGHAWAQQSTANP
jgi:hypothetical protein